MERLLGQVVLLFAAAFAIADSVGGKSTSSPGPGSDPFLIRDLFKTELRLRRLMEKVKERVGPRTKIRNEVLW